MANTMQLSIDRGRSLLRSRDQPAIEPVSYGSTESESREYKVIGDRHVEAFCLVSSTTDPSSCEDLWSGESLVPEFQVSEEGSGITRFILACDASGPRTYKFTPPTGDPGYITLVPVVLTEEEIHPAVGFSIQDGGLVALMDPDQATYYSMVIRTVYDGWDRTYTVRPSAVPPGPALINVMESIPPTVERVECTAIFVDDWHRVDLPTQVLRPGEGSDLRVAGPVMYGDATQRVANYFPEWTWGRESDFREAAREGSSLLQKVMNRAAGALLSEVSYEVREQGRESNPAQFPCYVPHHYWDAGTLPDPVPVPLTRDSFDYDLSHGPNGSGRHTWKLPERGGSVSLRLSIPESTNVDNSYFQVQSGTGYFNARMSATSLDTSTSSVTQVDTGSDHIEGVSIRVVDLDIQFAGYDETWRPIFLVNVTIGTKRFERITLVGSSRGISVQFTCFGGSDAAQQFDGHGTWLPVGSRLCFQDESPCWEVPGTKDLQYAPMDGLRPVSGDPYPFIPRSEGGYAVHPVGLVDNHKRPTPRLVDASALGDVQMLDGLRLDTFARLVPTEGQVSRWYGAPVSICCLNRRMYMLTETHVVEIDDRALDPVQRTGRCFVTGSAAHGLSGVSHIEADVEGRIWIR